MQADILALAQSRVDQAEVYGSEVDRTTVEFRANELYSQETRLTHGYGLRVIKNGRTGYAASTNPDRLNALVDAAVETAEWGRATRIELPHEVKTPEVKTFENRVIVLSARRMHEWGAELIDAVRARVPDLKLDINFDRTYRQLRLTNSAGLDHEFARSEFSLGITGLLVLDGLFWLSDYENLSDGHHPRISEIADRFESRARFARTRARLQSGTYPVIFAPQALPNLLYPIEFAVSGKTLEKGTSPLMGKVGQQLLDPKISIYDNPLLDHGLLSSPIDGEGIARRRTPLFERGIFRGFLFDMATAAACRQITTGSGNRDYASPPSPGTTNIEISPGDFGLEQALRAMDNGLLVYDCIGGGQSNIMAGDITLNISCGYKVESGIITGRVKVARIAGNVYEMLKKVEAVGDKCRDLGTYSVPFIELGDLKVAAR